MYSNFACIHVMQRGLPTLTPYRIVLNLSANIEYYRNHKVIPVHLLE